MICYNRFRIVKPQEIVINMCNTIIVQTFKIIPTLDIHLEARKKNSRKADNFQSK